jgi:predicted phosphodiesterase
MIKEGDAEVRYAVLSDVHANLHALEAVFDDLQSQEVDRYVCLGDIIGYGAFPEECIGKISSLGFITVAGNHDYAALGRIQTENFNALAKTATVWTRDQLSRESVKFLNTIPLVVEEANISFVHSSYYSPELFDYVQTSYDAHLSLSQLPGRVCFIGHSHIPVAFIQNGCVTYSLSSEIKVPDGGKVLMNVGSVGQPRDQDPRASYAIYDDENRKITLRRVSYDIEGAISGILGKGLPVMLGERLRTGR